MTPGSAGGDPPPLRSPRVRIAPVPCGEPGVYQVLLVEEDDTEGVVLCLSCCAPTPCRAARGSRPTQLAGRWGLGGPCVSSKVGSRSFPGEGVETPPGTRSCSGALLLSSPVGSRALLAEAMRRWAREPTSSDGQTTWHGDWRGRRRRGPGIESQGRDAPSGQGMGLAQKDWGPQGTFRSHVVGPLILSKIGAFKYLSRLSFPRG